MKLQMKREAMEKLNRRANEMVCARRRCTGVYSHCAITSFVHSRGYLGPFGLEQSWEVP